MKFDHSPRLLLAALSLSLLLHLLAVFGWSRAYPVPPAVPSPAMQVVVVAGPVAQVPAVNNARPKPAREQVREQVREHVNAPPKAHVSPVSAPVLAVEKPVPEAVQHVTPAVAPEKMPAVGAGAMTSRAAGGASLAATAGGVNEDGLRQYRIELAAAARRFRSYPAIARARGWEGVAEVSVVVSAGLPEPSLRLAKSSGHVILDEQAIDMLSRAAARTALPDSLRGKNFVVPMPIRFSLQD